MAPIAADHDGRARKDAMRRLTALAATDTLIWWAHGAHKKVTDVTAERRAV